MPEFETPRFQAEEVVASFVRMETSDKWDQFIALQESLSSTNIAQLTLTPEYLSVLFLGKLAIKDSAEIRNAFESIDWSNDDSLVDALNRMRALQVAAVSRDRSPFWQELCQSYPPYAALTIFLVWSLMEDPEIAQFVNSLTL